jgi:heat-inducible transcriptional repressor
MAAVPELGRREREILRALVQDYIQTGEPVASQPLIARHDLDCSSATVRNVMADLEALGFLAKPHASSGRVPTEQGYRLFVDALLQVRPPPPADRERIERVAQEAAQDLDHTLGGTAQLLHSLSHHAGVVTTPRPVADPIRQLEFVRLRENRVLAVFVSEAGLVTNKLLALDFALEPGELERAANYLNEKLRQGPVEGLRERILAEMR